MPKYRVIKTYGHSEGWSATYRQYKADSHCRFLHGYALSFEFAFVCRDLDSRDWVIDFGGLKDLKAALKDSFDHRTIVALDDPERVFLREAETRSVINNIHWVDRVGCESFAEMAAAMAQVLLNDLLGARVRLHYVQVAEHEGNSARYYPYHAEGS